MLIKVCIPHTHSENVFMNTNPSKRSITGSADPRLMGALRKTVSPAGGRGGGGVEEWMQRICLCFTPSRIALAEGARETVSLRGKLSTRFFVFF